MTEHARQQLRSPLIGTVVRLAQSGDVVRAGRAIAVLESMKMEHPVALDFDARIVAVHVELGATVSASEVLAVVEATDISDGPA